MPCSIVDYPILSHMSFHNWIDSPRLTYQWNSSHWTYMKRVLEQSKVIFKKLTIRLLVHQFFCWRLTVLSEFLKSHQKRRLVAHPKVSMSPGLDYAVCVCVFLGWQWEGKPYKTLGCGMLRSEEACFLLTQTKSQYVFKKSWECSTSFLFLVANNDKKSVYQRSFGFFDTFGNCKYGGGWILTWVSDRPCRPGRGANIVGGPKEAYNRGSFKRKMIFTWKRGFLVLEFLGKVWESDSIVLHVQMAYTSS